MKNSQQIEDSLKLLPEHPGVYLMYDKTNTIIYIGKAKNLKNRVRSYFKQNHDLPKLKIMVPQIEKFEYIITDKEIEALILESHLIKKHKPKYNVLLKDDKKFPWFLITDEDYPRIVITRKADKKLQKGKYFGPYTNSRAMYSTLELIKKLFPLKQCKTPRFRDRPCIYHQIGKCLAPCQRLVTPQEYKEVVKDVELLLSGRQTELINALKVQMDKYAEAFEYEKAAKYRDSYFDVMKIVEKQKVVSENTSVNQDIIGFDSDGMFMSIVLLKVRDGRLTGKEDFDIILDKLHAPEEAIVRFMQEYYQLVDEIPAEILLPVAISKDDFDLISEWLTIKKGYKVTLISPKQQTKFEMIELAIKNAVSSLEKLKLVESSKLQNDWNDVGNYIQEKLQLSRFPHRIECFDISHTQGTNTVASMVVFINGKSAKSEYRRFKIRSTEGKPDDFESMKEVIKRRYTDVLRNNRDLADLIIVDGGKGQLSSAVEILEEIGLLDVNIVSLAKRLEEVFIPEQSEPVIFNRGSQALFAFQNVRDEAHRFAVSYHRRLRENQSTKSIFDEIPEVGEVKKKQLFDHFGDLKGIINANESEIARVIGKKAAKSVYRLLHKK